MFTDFIVYFLTIPMNMYDFLEVVFKCFIFHLGHKINDLKIIIERIIRISYNRA